MKEAFMNKIGLKADMMLFAVAIIWGTGFIATEYAIQSGMSPMLILAFRFTVAALSLLIFTVKEIRQITNKEWVRGSIAGVVLFSAFYFQTLGQSLTTISNSAFITATNVIIVPFIVWVIAKKKPKLKTLILALMTFVGVAVLTVAPEGGFSVNIGDVYILVCAILFAFHIAYLEIAVSGSHAKRIAFIQISVAAVLSLLGLAVLDRGSINGVNYAVGLPAVLYLGLFSTSLCFFLQTSAQKYTSASKAGIIMSMESFFGSFFSILLGIEP